MPKRAEIPPDTFGPKRSALDKLVGASTSEMPPDTPDSTPAQPAVPSHRSAAVSQQSRTTGKQQRRMTVSPQNGKTVSPQNGSSATEKTTFYLRPDQLDKLDDLARDYRKRTGKRIKQQEVVRLLIDAATVDALIGDEEAS